jgi:release factor glutamine methyltransferase
MNKVFRILLRPLPWLLKGYLSRERTYHYKDLSIVVMPGVFHPGLFHSSTMLLQYIEVQQIMGTVLEIGGGTGIASILAAKKGAEVTSTDISPRAISNMKMNVERNGVTIILQLSDLFEDIAEKKFDLIMVNPPYYARKPAREEDYAWYCGEHHEYFVRFFKGIRPYTTEKTIVIMVLSEVCDLPVILRIASAEGFVMVKLAEKSVWVDGKNYLFQIKQTS